MELEGVAEFNPPLPPMENGDKLTQTFKGRHGTYAVEDMLGRTKASGEVFLRPMVTTTRQGVEMRRICVWCNRWEADTKGLACSAPDGDGHLFRLHPVVPEGRDGTG